MSEFYYGIIGEGHGLLSDKRIIVWKKDGSLRAFESIQEADNFYVALEDEAYFWEDSKWKPISFFLDSSTHNKVAKGFSFKHQN
jgi:hypothetical protein